jgi:tripartite-type tricarboxylate transporter receptor subunit TctC
VARRAIGAGFFAIGLSVFASAGTAQDYPSQPIRIVVPTQPGGVSDVLSRTFAQKARELTGATIIVENRTGANGVLAADHVAKSAPDGHTLYLGFQGTNAVLPHLDPKLPYNPAADFAPVVLIAIGPSVLTMHPSFPAKTLKEFVEIVKQKPKFYNYASAGFGTMHHLAAEMFNVTAGTEMLGVVYRGAAPAGQDVIAGHVPIVFDNIGNAMAHIKSEKVRPLALTAAERSPLLPELPTMKEQGYPTMVVASWFAFFAPAGTPPERVQWLNTQANRVFTSPEVRAVFSQQGFSFPLGTPDDLGRHVASEAKIWGEVIRKAGIKLPN